MSTQRNRWIGSLIFLSVMMSGWSLPATAAVEDLTIGDITLVSTTRVGRTVNEYVYTATVNNPAEALENVVGTVISTNPATQIVEGTVVFGSVATGTAQGADTFTFRHNRRYRFNLSNLSWSFTADEPQMNTAPVADAGVDQQVNVGSTVALNGLASSDADGDTLTYVWNLTRPAGSAAALSDPSSATPSFVADVIGQYVASLVVNDGTEDSAADATTITAVFAGDNPPAITSAPVTAGSVGEAYAYNVVATDPDQGDVLTYSLQLAPQGMVIDPVSGAITWVPGATGAQDVDVLVTDSTGLTARQIYLVVVNNGPQDQPPTLAPIADQSTVINRTVMVMAVGIDPEGEALRYGIVDGPGGVSINTTNGEFFWTPGTGQVGTFPVTISVTDPGGQQATTDFDVEVLQEQNVPPVIDAVADVTVMPLDRVQVTFSATDADVGDVLIFSLTGQPGDLQFDAASAALSWVPDAEDVGTLNLTATVTDSAGASDSTQFTITVTEPQAPPVAVNDAYTVDRNQQLQVPADGVLVNDSDPNNDVLTANNTSQPTLGTLDAFPGNGAFDYTPPANPPITIGLQEECRMPLNTGFAGNTQVVGDIDNDGEPEAVSIVGGFTNRMWVFGGDCSIESDVSMSYLTHGVFTSTTPPSLANLDDDPELEIVAVLNGPPELGIAPASLIAVNQDGSFVWDLPDGASEPVSFPLSANSQYTDQTPTIVDLDGDGTPEILMALRFFNGTPVGTFSGAVVAYNADGTVRWEYLGSPQGGDSDGKPVYVADLDLDGTVEVLSHTDVIDHNGQLEFLLPAELTLGGGAGAPHLTLAIANLDTDPFPEILAKNTTDQYVFSHTGAIQRRTPRALSTTSEITIAEFDGDPLPEYVYLEGTGNGNNASWLTAFDTDGTVLWTHEGTVYDGSGAGAQSNTGPSTMAFDFDRDGIDEIVIVMNAIDGGRGLFMFDGADGSLIDFFDGAGGEGPVQGQTVSIVDMDLDGEAEILYLDYTATFDNPFRILGGLDDNPFAPARPVRNQRVYVPTHVNTRGETLPYPQPHWLVPGLNKWNAAPVLPDEDPGAMDSFNYVANDGSADSNEATVSIQITNVNAPTIISSPVLGGSPDFPYQYGLLATDGDLGDVFTWTLVDAPAGMMVNTFGIIDWTPTDDDLGSHRVQVAVTDLQGNSDEQTYTIVVEPPVVVPNIVGSNVGDAGDDIVAAGLAIGSVTQAFSFDVPAGEVISQSVAGGATSAAGAMINYVISLGPQPIFVPTLTELGLSAAQAQLEGIGLALGAVTQANSDSVPAGVVIAQAVATGSEVPFQSTVDLTVSTGPTLQAAISAPLVAAGTTLGLTVETFDQDGTLLNPQAPVTLTIVAGDGAEGTVPVASLTQVTTGADTRGAFTLQVDAGALGSRSIPFMVRGDLGAGSYYEAIAQFADAIDEANATYVALVSAIESNDVASITALGQQLVALRDSIDLEVLASRNPAAPEEGFLPSFQDAILAGFPASFGELDQGAFFYGNLESALENSTSFLQSLNAAVGRDDDIRARALNNTLDAAWSAFAAIDWSVGASVNYSAENYVLLSKLVPELVVADLNATISILQDNGLLAQVEGAGVELIALEQRSAPAELFADTRTSFFTLGGMMTASAIRSQLIKDLYVPHITRLMSAGMVLADADALRENSEIRPIGGLITGSSLAFHIFQAPNSVAEVAGLSRDSRSFNVTIIGPDRYQAWLDLATSFEIPTSFDDIEELAQAAADAQAASLAGRQTTVVHDRIPGCIIEVGPDCSQLVFGFGFPVVHSSGQFPAPAIIILHDRTEGRIYFGVFAFFPN